MTFKITTDLAALMLGQIKAELDGGFLYIFAGSVPSEAADALDMSSDHTQLAMLSIDGDGATGLEFDAASGAVIAKVSADTWRGLVSFDGTESAETELTPTFMRFGAAGDDCRSAATGPRLQGTVGGPSSAEDVKMGASTLTDNGTNTTSMAIFTIQLTG